MHRLSIAVVAALAAALVVVSLSAAAHQQSHAKHTFPHRIISLSPTVTEDLFAIGAGKQVVAVDNQSNYPTRAPRTSLSGYTPNVEAIANYHPDLVLISYDPGDFDLTAPAARDQGRERGGREQPQAGIRGDSPARASHGTQPRRERCRALDADASGGDRAERPDARSRHLRVYHELDRTYYSATSQTFIGSIYKLFGFRDIADAASGLQRPEATRSSRTSTSSRRTRRSSSSPTRSAASRTYATVAARPGWSTISAVQHHRVVEADDDVASRWGPRIVQFARTVARIAKRS